MNRRGFEARMRISIAAPRRTGWSLTVVTIDIDHAKHINDRYGPTRC